MIEYKYIVDDKLYCEVEFYVPKHLDYDLILYTYKEFFKEVMLNEKKQVLIVRKGFVYDNLIMNLKIINEGLLFLSENNCKNKIAFCHENPQLQPIADTSQTLMTNYNLNFKIFTDCKKAKDWLLSL